MKWSRLHNIFLKDKTETNRKKSKLKETLTKNFSKPQKKKKFDTLDKKLITNNKTFWKIILPHFTQ